MKLFRVPSAQRHDPPGVRARARRKTQGRKNRPNLSRLQAQLLATQFEKIIYALSQVTDPNGSEVVFTGMCDVKKCAKNAIALGVQGFRWNRLTRFKEFEQAQGSFSVGMSGCK